MRIAVVQGTRPEIVKNYAIVRALTAARVQFEVLHTNQHTDRRMCGNVYQEMEYEPDRSLPGRYTLGRSIDWLQRAFRRDRISHVIVNGDTAASLAGALAAMYMDITVSHVEAGLRSEDPFMREERNRIMVDAIATSLFAYTCHEQAALHNTPGLRGSIFLEGNTTVDVLHDFAPRFEFPVRRDAYVYVTLHRKELTESKERLATLVTALRKIAEDRCSVVFPVHPRTADALRRFGLRKDLGAVEAIQPVSPFESIALQKHAAAVLTDSGCIQEEAYLLHVPCVTLRNNTERHLTVLHGANVVTGFALRSILDSVARACSLAERSWPDIYGPPGAGRRIVRRILEQARQPAKLPVPRQWMPGEVL